MCISRCLCCVAREGGGGLDEGAVGDMVDTSLVYAWKPSGGHSLTISSQSMAGFNERHLRWKLPRGEVPCAIRLVAR